MGKFESSDVLGYVSKLSSSNSVDCYGFSNNIVKSLIETIVTPLSNLYNMMLEQGIFPSALKLTKILPIYKKSDKTNPPSYRPISLFQFSVKSLSIASNHRSTHIFLKIT